MDLTALYTVIGSVLCATLGVFVRQVVLWLNSKSLVNSEKLKKELLSILQENADTGIAVANQEFVDRLKSNGNWQNASDQEYEKNSNMAFNLAKSSAMKLLTERERKIMDKVFGENKSEDVVGAVVLKRLRESKTKNEIIGGESNEDCIEFGRNHK